MLLKRMPSLCLGSDPEIFIQDQNGRIIGSERVVPENLEKGRDSGYYSRIIRDGVQVELNPATAYSGIAEVGNNLSQCFNILRHTLVNHKISGLNACFDSVVEVDRQELFALSKKARELGCAPSKNVYGLKPMKVNGSKYFKRSAGGHIHLGIDTIGTIFDARDVDERQMLIPLLDIFVGNTGVLLDRDPEAVERRKLYGMAGQFRLPKYGVEYRVLSNFWLKSYALADLMFGLASFAVSFMDMSVRTNRVLEEDLISKVSVRKVVQAIQTNDWNLAMENFLQVKRFISEHAASEFPLSAGNVAAFERFAYGVNEFGLDNYFNYGPIGTVNHWADKKFMGFREFIAAL